MRFPFPNLLASKGGRLTAFFFLYMTEGIPLGFTATAVATQMRRQGVGVEQIGIFVATLYLPWAWKWLMGPVVDLAYINALGRRRMWIVGCQVMMIIMLMSAMEVNFTTEMKLFTSLIFVMNLFGATQDVAIDALACEVLSEQERGLANGLMFGGAYTGNAIGGSGVLFLSSVVGFNEASLLVIVSLFAVTLFIAIPLRERRSALRNVPRREITVVVGNDELVDDLLPCIDCGESMRGLPLNGLCPACGTAVRHSIWRYEYRLNTRIKQIGFEIVRYIIDAFKAFFGSIGAIVTLLFAFLPCGAYALSLVLASSLSVEMGLTDAEIALLGLFTTICSAVFCVVGGLLSDRYGRRKLLAIYLIAAAVPTAWLGYIMHEEGFIWSIPADANNFKPFLEGFLQSWFSDIELTLPRRPDVTWTLVIAYYMLSIAYAVFHGLMYGTRTALFMDVCNPKVAATQFTAYMAILNLVIAYTAIWQGFAIKKWGYPTTLAMDAGIGLVCILLLPLIRREKQPSESDQKENADSGKYVDDGQAITQPTGVPID